MAESYVEATMAIVERACSAISVSPSDFWDWLGNVYFVEDGHSLSPQRAHEIRMHTDSLLEKFQEAMNEQR